MARKNRNTSKKILDKSKSEMNWTKRLEEEIHAKQAAKTKGKGRQDDE